MTKPVRLVAQKREPMNITGMMEFIAALTQGDAAKSFEKTYPVKAPELFPGVVPNGHARRAQTAAKNDPALLGPYLALDSEAMAPFYSYANQFNCGVGFPGYAYLSELAQKSEFRAPVETIADEMVRKWIKFTTQDEGDKSDKIRDLTEACEKFKLRECIRLMLQHDQYFGRAQIYPRINGQTDDVGRQLPLVIDPKTVKKGSLLGFKVIEPIWTTPYTYDSLDPTEPDFFKPRAWYVMGKRTHASRLITICSRPVPDILKPAFNFGGMSVSQLIEPYVGRWLSTVSAVNQLIRNYSIIILATNMQATLQGSADTGVFARAKLFTQMRDNQGLFLTDKDQEEIKQVAVPLSGLSELQAQAQEHMAAPTHIPLVKLTGITPDGLNASSEGEIQVFYDYILAQQEAVLRDPIRTLLNLIQLSEFGEIDPDISFQFEPLASLSAKELAEVRKSDADAGVGYITAGVITNQEERERLKNDPLSGYNNLTGEAPEPELPETVDEDGNPIEPEAGPPTAAPPGKGKPPVAAKPKPGAKAKAD